MQALTAANNFVRGIPMVHYDLSHLTQQTDQRVWGPIQDDEALALYALIKCMRFSRVLELGGLHGYSAQNFLASVGSAGRVYTVDTGPVPRLAPNHTVITKDVADVTPADLDGVALDLVFFDCHASVQMDLYTRLAREGIITDATVLALHDTNVHYGPFNGGEAGREYVHQPVERAMANTFKLLGYDVLCLHTTADKHSPEFPFRHGLTLCQKFKPLRG